MATTKETALLQALGIPVHVVQQIRVHEHVFGGLAGLLIGVLSAVWASVDTFVAQPLQVLGLTGIVMVSVGGIILVVVKSSIRQLAMRQTLVNALASE